jgi:hypothetical protein
LGLHPFGVHPVGWHAGLQLGPQSGLHMRGTHGDIWGVGERRASSRYYSGTLS